MRFGFFMVLLLKLKIADIIMAVGCYYQPAVVKM